MSHFFFWLNSGRIEEFIDDNKALMRRMYGDFLTLKKSSPSKRKREATDFDGVPGVPDITAPYDDIVNLATDYESGDSYFAKWRARRQANKANKSPTKPNVELNPTSEPVSGRFVFDFCFIVVQFEFSTIIVYEFIISILRFPMKLN